MALILWLGLGTVIGLAVRVGVRDRKDLNLGIAVLIGVLGAFVGGTFGNVLANKGITLASTGGIGAAVGAVFLLVAFEAAGSSHTSNG